jgi:hypothetical protein
MSEIDYLSTDWLRWKAQEEEAVIERRKIEDQIVEILKLPEAFESTETVEPLGLVLKIVGRIDRKIDSVKLQELALEAGLSDHLPNLFRWKPEINMAVWKAADESITRPLAGAITVKPGRPSFKITFKE